MSGFVYLASPYSHSETKVRVARFRAARQAVIDYFKLQIPVFSPIVHWHHIQTTEDGWGHDYTYFRVQNDAMVAGCGEVRVLALAGWRESSGVSYEIDLAKRLDKPVNLVYTDIHGHPMKGLEPL